MRQTLLQRTLIKVWLIIALLMLAMPVVLSADDGIIATIGRTNITRQDISYRIWVERAYGNKKITATTTLVLIVNDLFEKEVGLGHGVSVTSEEIAAFRKYADQNTRAPEILVKVKAVFKGDEAAYARLYLEPRIMNRKLHYFYSRDAAIHKNERTLIEEAYSLAVSGKTMKEAAEESGLEYLTVSNHGDKKTEVPSALVKYLDSSEPQDPLFPIVEKLQPGQIYDHIVEDDNGYQVIRLLEKDGKKYSVESILSKKRPFDEWFREEEEKIKIEILDHELKKKIEKSYPNMWWVKRIAK